jgi:hypothetical protein
VAGRAAAATTTNLYVSPTGSDSNSGTSADSPLKTLERAKDVVRGIDQSTSGEIRVNLAGGVYRLSAPLSLTAQDSGTNGHQVVWAAAPGARPVISGGVKVTGWTRTDTGRNIWSAPVPAGTTTRQVYVNGGRAQRATGALPVSVKQTDTGYTTSSGDPMAKWHNRGQVEFVYRGGLGAWTEPRCGVATITSTTITMDQPCWDNSTRRVMRTDGSGRTYELVGRQKITEAPTAVENAYELLDKPGEWYLDSSTSTLNYIPRSGEDLSTADVEVAAAQTLLSVTGTVTAPVHDLTFQGIQFSYATWTTPNGGEGFSEIQADYTLTGTGAYATQGLCTFVKNGSCPYGAWTKLPGNVSLAYDQNIHFDRDAFVHLGAAGLDLGDGSRNDSVTGCVFTDTSGNGLELGGVDIPLPTSAGQHTSGDVISDNHFTNLPVEYHGGVAIDIGYVEHATISHNQIDHVAYAGISIGWGGWPDKVKLPAQPNYSNHNTLSDNLIFNHMSLLGDGGGIYTNGITGTSLSTGEHVTGNIVHDQKNATGGHALYTDNGASYVTISGNGEYNNTVGDWGSKHVNYTLNDGSYDPLDIEGNYWEKGAADYNQKSVVIKSNHTITSAGQIPSSIVAAAGLEPAYADILNWTPAA